MRTILIIALLIALAITAFVTPGWALNRTTDTPTDRTTDTPTDRTTDTPTDRTTAVLPPTATPPAATPPAETIALDYQDDAAGGCAASTNPDGFAACWLQKAQAGLVTPTDAIVKIQELAAANNVPSHDGWTSLEADPHAPMFIWCPGGDGTFIPDTARPLEDPRLDKRWHNTVGVIQPHPASDPASIRTVTCPSTGWAIPLK